MVCKLLKTYVALTAFLTPEFIIFGVICAVLAIKWPFWANNGTKHSLISGDITKLQISATLAVK